MTAAAWTQAIATAVLVVLTAWYIRLTKELVTVNRDERERQRISDRQSLRRLVLDLMEEVRLEQRIAESVAKGDGNMFFSHGGWPLRGDEIVTLALRSVPELGAAALTVRAQLEGWCTNAGDGQWNPVSIPIERAEERLATIADAVHVLAASLQEGGGIQSPATKPINSAREKAQDGANVRGILL